MTAKEKLEVLIAILAFFILSPVFAILMLFYEEDPEDSYKYQNW